MTNLTAYKSQNPMPTTTNENKKEDIPMLNNHVETPDIAEKASYKIPCVLPQAMWPKEIVALFDALHVSRDGDDWNLEQKANGQRAFRNLESMMTMMASNPFVVNINDCVVNNAKQSIASDVCYVTYDSYKPTRNMITVKHALFDMIKATWIVAGNNQKQAEARIERLKQIILYRLQHHGVELHYRDGNARRYSFLGATPSQQKVGSMYMADVEILKREEVQKAFNAGKLFADFNEMVETNATELITMNSYMFTPCCPTKWRVHDLIVMDSVKIKQTFKKICRVNEDGTLTRLTDEELEVTKFDGQTLFMVSGQLRAWMLKSLGVRKDAVEQYAIDLEGHDHDEIIEDKYGVQHVLKDCCGITTTDSWKGSKYFKTYQDYLKVVDELTEYYPNFDKVWVVREAGVTEDGELVEDFGRTLSRQATQQFISATLAEIAALTKQSRNHLLKLKTFDGLYKLLAEESKDITERSDYAALIEALPELMLTESAQTKARETWNTEKMRACANKIRCSGNYPYICQDPVAMYQILVYKHDPNEEGLGLLKDGEVNNPKYRAGRKLFSIRYPANYLTACVVKNVRHEVYDHIGDVAVVPYYGDWIIRQDGDFDGDEAMFSPNKLIIKLAEEMIAKYQPELIDFDHGRKAERHTFATMIDAKGNLIHLEGKDVRRNRNTEIAMALWRAMKFNTVGIYSNLAVRCFWLRDTESAIIAHVMAILSIDMVKGTAVPEKLVEKAEGIKAMVDRLMEGKMPWNQFFRDQLKRVTRDEYLPLNKNSTPDMIASLINADVGEYEFDAQDHVFTGEHIKLLMNGTNSSTRKGVLSKKLADAFRDAYSRTDMKAEDIQFYRDIANGSKVGMADVIAAGDTNMRSMMYTCAGDTIRDKKESFMRLIREACFSLGGDKEWTDQDGNVIPEEERRNRVVNAAARMIEGEHGEFVAHVFALDFLHNVERNRGIAADETFEARRLLAMEANTLDMHEDIDEIDDLDDIDA